MRSFVPTPSIQKAVTAQERIGTVLGGWRLDVALGESATNTVYAVSDRFGQSAALRLMHGETRADPGVRRRAFREASTIRALAHPGTVAILMADVTTLGEPYVVMERLWGLDTARLCAARGGALELKPALAIATQALELLQVVHARGITHRNIQPVTLFGVTAGDVRLLDFGSALLPNDTGDQSLDALGLGVNAWMAPELSQRTTLGDARCDVFSLGLAVICLVNGELGAVPQGPDAIAEALDRLAQRIDRLPAALRDDVVATLRTATEWDPGRRFPAAGPMRDRFAELAARLGMADLDACRAVVAGEVEPHAPRDENQQQTRSWLAYDTLRSIFERVERALYQARRTHWDDPETEVRVAEVLAGILEAVRSDASGITFQIRPSAFELLGRPVWEPRHPFELIPYRLFDAGFRKIRLLPSLGEDECRRFLRWLVTNPDEDLAREDDLATLYWRNEFVAVRCDLVSSVVLQDLNEYDVLDRELQAIQSEALVDVRRSLSTRFDEHDEDVDPTDVLDDDQLLAVQIRETVGLLPEADLGVLRERLNGDRGHVGMRLAELVVRTHEATPESAERRPSAVVAAFDVFVHEQIGNGAVMEALEIFAAVRRQLADRSNTEQFVSGFQSPVAVRRLLDIVVPIDNPAYRAARPVAAATHGLLDASGAFAFEVAAQALARCEDDLMIAVLERYLLRHVAGRGAAIGEQLALTTVAGGVALLRALWAVPDDQATAATRRALENALPDVRLDAFARLVANAARVASEAFIRLLVDSDPTVRRASIRIAVQGHLNGAFATLVKRMRDSAAFDALQYAERQQILVALLDLDPTRGEEAIAAALLEEGALSSHARDQSRTLMADILGERAELEETLKSVRTLHGVRFWTSKAVRESAKVASERIEARLRGGPGAG